MPRVLIVDDEAAFGKTASRALSTRAEVALELTPAGALDRIRAGERFDVILCDVMMPDMTGPELFEAVLGVAPELRERFVFVSGGMTEALEEDVEATGRPLLRKPLRLADLRDLVR